MKTKEIAKKKFDAVNMMREIRNKIDKETEGLNFAQLKQYYKESALENFDRARK